MSKEPKKDLPLQPGRTTFDDRGNAIWEWRTDAGTFTCDVDTVQVRTLQDNSPLRLAEPSVPTGQDPYSTATDPRNDEKKKPRRTLSDMRELSEEIKRSRANKKPSG